MCRDIQIGLHAELRKNLAVLKTLFQQPRGVQMWSMAVPFICSFCGTHYILYGPPTHTLWTSAPHPILYEPNPNLLSRSVLASA